MKATGVVGNLFENDKRVELRGFVVIRPRGSGQRVVRVFAVRNAEARLKMREARVRLAQALSHSGVELILARRARPPPPTTPSLSLTLPLTLSLSLSLCLCLSVSRAQLCSLAK
jgi:hypothetical protein